MVDVGVTNPVAGLTTVAIVPFFNLSQERTVDGQRFAIAYFTELQKTPGFQVIPVGVVEQVIYDHRLEMNNPDDVLQLAKLLNVDAVVVGAVTDYSPYYPPRIGLQVSWYSPRPWAFYPGIPTDEFARQAEHPGFWERIKLKRHSSQACPPETMMPVEPVTSARGQTPDSRSGHPALLLFGDAEAKPAPLREIPIADVESPLQPAPALQGSPSPPVAESLSIQNPLAFDPRQPLMSYTRMFDGSDPKLTARLRDYSELSGDLRAGGWEARLSRSEDFIRFSAHVMIVEMLQLHGGEAQKRVVFKFRKYR
jgi:hypothetical protein